VQANQILSDMEALDMAPDFDVFGSISEALCAILPLSQSVRGNGQLSTQEIAEVNNQSVAMTKAMFCRLVTGHGSFSELANGRPNLAIPPPYCVLAFVRVLGLVGDQKAMMTVLQWMCQSADLLDATARESLTGRRKLRLVLVTIRIFLERLWADDCFLQDRPVARINGPVSPSPDTQHAKELVERIPQWDGWPRDEEVRDLFLTTPEFSRWTRRLKVREALGVP